MKPPLPAVLFAFSRTLTQLLNLFDTGGFEVEEGSLWHLEDFHRALVLLQNSVNRCANIFHLCAVLQNNIKVRQEIALVLLIWRHHKEGIHNAGDSSVGNLVLQSNLQQNPSAIPILSAPA